MLDWLPPGADLQQDVSSADWVVERLRSWDDEGARVWSFLPDTFDAYARVLHPPRSTGSRSGLPATWRALAARRGVPLAPDVSFAEVLGAEHADDAAFAEIAPLDGELPGEVCLALRSTLARRTSERDRCWFWVWDGSGLLWSYAHTTLTARSDVDTARPRPVDPAGRGRDELLERTARVRIDHRSYFLIGGPLVAACGFLVGGWAPLTPNLWYPDDRAWCVATEIEGYSTYVGGSSETIEDVLDAPDLEAVEVRPETHLDVGPYLPRWRPRYPEHPPR
jgi:hypothetical protein